MAFGGSATTLRSLSPCQRPTSAHWAFPPSRYYGPLIPRAAGYGPVRPVVWEGCSREAAPYPDCWSLAPLKKCALEWPAFD
jgi:hypothetical protein